ncbi:MAG: alpha/beta hydrolase [Erysipelotrichaceae bacterium]|nr:alpha/beta hydrolase [Erysipelotrichaceae bacterium]
MKEYCLQWSDRRTEYFTASDGCRLEMEVFLPQDHGQGKYHPAIVFYYGGGFARRNRDNFYRYSAFFANEGYVCINPDYRLQEETGDLKRCYQDGIEAFEAVCMMADRYEINTSEIIVCGSSSGGSLSAHVALKTGLPQAMVLIAPGVAWQYRNIDYVELPGSGMKQIIDLESVRHEDWEQAYYLLDDHPLPRTLIIVGTGDEVCYRGSALFQKKALEKGYDCRMVLVEGQPHGFANWGRTENNFGFYTSLDKMNEYLQSLKSEKENGNERKNHN